MIACRVNTLAAAFPLSSVIARASAEFFIGIRLTINLCLLILVNASIGLSHALCILHLCFSIFSNSDVPTITTTQSTMQKHGEGLAFIPTKKILTLSALLEKAIWCLISSRAADCNKMVWNVCFLGRLSHDLSCKAWHSIWDPPCQASK